MDFKDYLPNTNEDEATYAQRLWLTDLWDKIPFNVSIAPNSTISTLQKMKWHVWTRDRKQLAGIMRSVEDELRSVTCNKRYAWLQMYARRIYKRKNMVGMKKYNSQARSVSPVGFAPSPLRTT